MKLNLNDENVNVNGYINLITKKAVKLLTKKFRLAIKAYTDVFAYYRKISFQLNFKYNRNLKVDFFKFTRLYNFAYDLLSECFDEGMDQAGQYLDSLEDLQEWCLDNFAELHNELEDFISTVNLKKDLTKNEK